MCTWSPPQGLLLTFVKDLVDSVNKLATQVTLRPDVLICIIALPEYMGDCCVGYYI